MAAIGLFGFAVGLVWWFIATVVAPTLMGLLRQSVLLELPWLRFGCLDLLWVWFDGLSRPWPLLQGVRCLCCRVCRLL